MEAGKMKLYAREINILPLLNLLIKSFESLAKKHKIDIKFQCTTDEILIYIDQEKIEEIITNLLSNAFKYTPDGGMISMNVQVIKNRRNTSNLSLEISISNTGPGIPPDTLKYIFKRYYQVDNTQRHMESSGIGLALVHELVKLHKGSIRAESELNQQTRFIIKLPLGCDHLSADDIVTDKIARSTELEYKKKIQDRVDDINIKLEPVVVSTGTKMLIVEDNYDMRMHLAQIFEKDFTIIEAENGKKGLEYAKKYIPDFIISDVMMPEMDGLSFCRILKTDEETCHIPIILLTARGEDIEKLEGLETGADDYITKPFERKELHLQVINILKQRKRMRLKFAEEFNVHPGEITATKTDEKFLKEAY